jgi:hypothetical protein
MVVPVEEVAAVAVAGGAHGMMHHYYSFTINCWILVSMVGD